MQLFIHKVDLRPGGLQTQRLASLASDPGAGEGKLGLSDLQRDNLSAEFSDRERYRPSVHVPSHQARDGHHEEQPVP